MHKYDMHLAGLYNGTRNSISQKSIGSKCGNYQDTPRKTYRSSECPANRTERRKLLTDDMLNITDSHKKATAILNSQARTGHIKLMQLIRKYPVMQ